MWCNHDNSVHIHPITNHRQHRTSKKLLTQETRHTGVGIIDYIVNTEQRSLFTFRHTISEQ